MWHPQHKFPQTLKESSAEERIAYFEKGFVLKHEMISQVQQAIRQDFFESSEQQIALVVGPTGVGKSCLAHAVFKELYENVPDGEEGRNLPVVYFEADVHSTGGFSWKDFYARLLFAMGELEETRIYGKPLSAEEGGGRKYSSRHRTEHQLRKDFELRIKDYGVKYILLDEIQHVFKYGGKAAERNLDILKNISNKTDCRFIGLGTYEISFSVDKSAQLSRRIVTIEFPGYASDSKREYKKFLSAYSGLLAHMPVMISKDLAKYSNEAYVGCCGCIGILKEWLNRALRRALADDAELSIGHLQGTRLKGSQLISIAEEIKEGKAFFEEPEDSEIMLLLGLGASEEAVSDKPKSKAKKIKPGERKPSRDKVG